MRAYDCGLEREAQREGKDVPVLLLAPGLGVHAVVRVQEHDEPRLRDRLPHGLERVVVEALADAARAHDDAAQVREPGDLLDGLEQRGDGRLARERQQAEAVQPAQRRRVVHLGRRRAVRLEVGVQLAGEDVGGRGGEKVKPWVRRAFGWERVSGCRVLRVSAAVGRVGAHLTMETSMPCLSMNLSFSFLSQYCKARSFRASATPKL